MTCVYDESVVCPYTHEMLMDDPDLCCICKEVFDK